MEKAGGYLDYVALCEDARAYDDVLIILAGEADAGRIASMNKGAK